MATKNPFGQLRVDRDDDEEVTQTVNKTGTTPIFNVPAVEEKKKKKVRPDEKKKIEETQVNSNEGFEVVGKKQHQKHQRSNQATEEEFTAEGKLKENENPHSSKAHHQRIVKMRPGKRLYERHSGTGRGKEISKGGAGGKTVWGDNPEFIAKQAHREEYNRDNDYFENALNPKPRKVKEEVPEAPKEEVKEATPQEEIPVVEEKTEQPEETFERKRKEIPEEPIKPEELLERPEGALSLAEYKEQLKEKNKKLQSTNAKSVKIDLPSDLKVLEKDNFGVKVVEKKQPEKKSKKADNAVQQLVVQFKTEDSSFKKDKNYYGDNKKSKPAPKLRFEDLPSL